MGRINFVLSVVQCVVIVMLAIAVLLIPAPEPAPVPPNLECISRIEALEQDLDELRKENSTIRAYIGAAYTLLNKEGAKTQ